MNNRRTAPGGQTTHMLSAILAKVTNIEKLLAPAVHNLPDSEILDSKGVRLLRPVSIYSGCLKPPVPQLQPP